MDEVSGNHSIEKTTKYRKSYFDVLGICCSSEVPLVEKIVQALEGVVSVSVIVATRTVIVVHDEALVSQTEIGNNSLHHYPVHRPHSWVHSGQ